MGQIEVPEKPKRRPNEVSNPIIKKKGIDPQLGSKVFVHVGDLVELRVVIAVMLLIVLGIVLNL